MLRYLEWLGLISLTAAVLLIFSVVIYVVATNAKEFKKEK